MKETIYAGIVREQLKVTLKCNSKALSIQLCYI